jgi:crotonobetainyl-CoA:carnitine CoA-transferase CaiB-like acyl-CoA transferase
VSEAVLAGVRIVDLSDGIAGPTATMVLAEAGAEVVMVEPPGGLRIRGTAGFRTWARSKQSVVLDVETADGRARLESLLAGADVLVHSYGPTRAAELALDDASVAFRHPALIVSSVLAWPANHACADLPVDDLLTLARLGILDEQQGLRDGPIYVRFPLGSWGAVWLAAIGIVARLVARGRTGDAGPAHTSLVQGALVPMMMHWSRAETPSDALRIGMPKDRMYATLYECSDGVWIHVMPPNPDALPLMREVFAEMGPAGVAEANATHGEGLPMYPNWGADREGFRRRPARQWLEHMWENDHPVQEVLPLGAILRDEQALANRYVIELDDPEAGRITVPGHAMTLDPPARVVSPAPALGEHQETAGARWAPRTPVDVRSAAFAATPGSTRVASKRWPLEGLRVLDFGNYLAGPLGPMLLADLGADVVKVEATTGDPMRWPDWPFAGCQRGKRAVALDLKSAASRPALDALLRWADVVHHNLRMPAARRLGLDAQSVQKVNPALVFCHTSSYGPAGPRADWPGYDQLFQASIGWELLGAGEGNPPMWHRFGFMDHQCAMSSAVATLLAIFERDRTGRASSVAASLLGAGVLTTSETHLRPDGTLIPVPTLDHDQMVMTPGCRLLRCADGWVAMAAHLDNEVAAACAALGCHHPDGLAEAASGQSQAEVLRALTAAAVPVEAVRLDQREAYFDDPANIEAGMVASYRHADWGAFEQPGALWHFGNLATRFEHAPPVIGQHTVEVLLEAGLDRAAIDDLLDCGAAKAAHVAAGTEAG